MSHTFRQHCVGHPQNVIAKQRKMAEKGSKGQGPCPTFVSNMAEK